MDAIVYTSKPEKKVNGSMFYCFEYFIFLKQYLPRLKFIIMNVDRRNSNTASDLEFFKNIFKDKYNFDHTHLNDIIFIKAVEFMMLNIKHVLMFDVHTYSQMQDYLGRVETVFLYANKPNSQNYVNKNPRDTFYGWYDYQYANVKARLKLYKEIHKTFAVRGDKIFITSPNGDNEAVAKMLDIDPDDVLIKLPNDHHQGLFERINKIIYWHFGNNDANNRLIVEAAIHNIPVEIHVNDHTDDSVQERKKLIEAGQVDELFLNKDDIMIKDFLKVCGA